jgi:hypothetical protein
MKIHKNPKLLEFDDTEGIIDIFVKKDPNCPYPFTNGEWYHQGFLLKNFIIYLKDFFERNNLPYKVGECEAE